MNTLTARFPVAAALSFFLGLGGTASHGQAAKTNRLAIQWPASSSQPFLSVEAAEDGVTIIQRSSTFQGWTELLRGHGPIAPVPDLSATGNSQRFYRAATLEKAGVDDWKNVLRGRADVFQSVEPPPGKQESRWVKFVLLTNAPHRTVFQDSSKYAFHYDFAVTRLPEFQNLTRAQFDAVTLHTNGQKAVLGAVLFSPTTNLLEAGLQFVGLEPYPRESIATWFHTVRPMLGIPTHLDVYYMPTFEQRDVALANTAWFAERGIRVSSISRWVITDEIYAAGWALGRLVFVLGTDIDAAYRAGLLEPDDILLTDAVPAEVPPLAGIISLSPATPNSHVALLAKSFGIPFVYVAQPGFSDKVMSWEGRDILLRAVDFYGQMQVIVVPIADGMPDPLRAEIAALKIPPRLNLSARTNAGYLSISANGLTPADIRSVGGKAANYGILRRSVPDNSPSPALAFTFDLWEGYLNQQLPDQRILRAVIAQQLGHFTWPPNMAELKTALATVRDLFTDTANFSPSQRAAILGVLQSAGFTQDRKIRFRSSTNVEDSEQFSGAGLYDSFSGCLGDDLDGDTRGPSLCDPSETNERGVFRALRKVFASFYNDNAFLERLRHGVNETNVGMAVLVHYSTPDEFELANGVATLEIRNYSSSSWQINTRLVTQLGAVSVTNPDTAARPEEVQVVDFASGTRPFASVVARSSLVPLGDTVMRWEQEYLQLYGLLKSAARRWQEEQGTNELVTLDFEYKKETPEHLSVKQIRVVPPPPPATRNAPYLIGATNRYAVFQGEFGDVVSNHRLKSLWALTTRHAQLTTSNLASTVLASVEAEWRHGTNVFQFSGSLTELPDYQFSRTEDHSLERWAMGTGSTRRQFELRIFDLDSTTSWLGPLVLLDDHRMELSVTYASPQASIHFDDFSVTNTLTDRVWLAPVVSVNFQSKRQYRHLVDGPLSITTEYYWPRDIGGTGAGYTAPLIKWAGTTLTGLTSRPITLEGEFSQTYRPGHHNSSEDFVFDPWLEPGVDPDLLEELALAGIRAVIVRLGQPATPFETETVKNVEPGQEMVFLYWGLDGHIRPRK